MLSFQLLGPVSLYRNEDPLTQFRSQKETALLLYLAQTGQTESREFMADLLWENRFTQQARSNLRTVLTRLRKQVSDDELIIARKTVALAPESQQQIDSVILLQQIADMGEIDTLEKANNLQRSLDAYQGPFLADFRLNDAPQFEQWVLTTREQIHRQVIAAYQRLGTYLLATGAIDNGAIDSGIATARRWLDVDALDEAAHTLLIRLLLKAGRSDAAITHYEYLTDLLQKELGVAPAAAITALIPPPSIPQPSRQQRVARPRHNLPVPYDQFFGRVAAQQDMDERLDQPWCRLVTLVGQGGVGKTRLATTVARSRVDRYRDGVWLVELAEIDRDDDLTEAIAVEIATVLGLRLSGSASPVEQLLNDLQHRAMLLILDNFEHLLEGGVELVLALLQRCEEINLLVTSREALHIRSEWTISLAGLDYPTTAMDERHSDAVTLFAARRAQGECATMSTDELAAVCQICRLVEGLPLAIELAAALVHRIPLRKLAAELQDGFSLLTTSLRDVPARHRSLQIVFELSWCTLTGPLQRRLARLSLFRGGFTERAAQQVTNTSTQQLTALAEKSLLTYNAATERYLLHPVVRAYAAEKQKEHTDAASDPTRQKHTHYYLTLLAQQGAVLQEDAPQQALAVLEPELENLRLAWQSGGLDHQAELLAAALTALAIY